MGSGAKIIGLGARHGLAGSFGIIFEERSKAPPTSQTRFQHFGQGRIMVFDYFLERQVLKMGRNNYF